MSETNIAELGSTPHPDPLPDRGGEGSLQTATSQRPPLRVRPVVVKPREKMTARELMNAARDHQAGIALEGTVRRLAREQGLDPAEITKLGEAARVAFRIVDGEPVPVAADRQTVVLAADGLNTLSVTEWVKRKVRDMQPRNEKGTWQMDDDEEVLPMRNPFRRKTWNLTEQMRLQRRDPKLARRLKAEAWADGENLKR